MSCTDTEQHWELARRGKQAELLSCWLLCWYMEQGRRRNLFQRFSFHGWGKWSSITFVNLRCNLPEISQKSFGSTGDGRDGGWRSPATLPEPLGDIHCPFLKGSSRRRWAVGWAIEERVELQKNYIPHCHGKFMLSKHYQTQNDMVHSLLCNKSPCLPGML